MRLRFVFQICNSTLLEPLKKKTKSMISSTQTNHPLQGGVASANDSVSRLEVACARLREVGLRITQPRIAIIKTLIGHSHPVSIEQIHAELKIRSCDLVTVYRCLGAFEDIGLVRRSFFHNGTSLYHLADRNEAAYYVVSKDTNEIRGLDVGLSAELATAIKKVEDQLEAEGYENITHVLEFFAKSPSTAANRAEQPAVQIPAL